jgi:hypothetical protein
MNARNEILCLLSFVVMLPLSLQRGLCKFGGCNMDSVGCYTAVWFVNNSGSELHIELEAKVDGDWLGISFSNTPSMEDSDLKISYKKNTQTIVEDRSIINGSLIPVETDQNVFLGSDGMSEGGFTRITFTRHLVSDDTRNISYDLPLYIMLARGPSLDNTTARYTWMNVTSEPMNVTECLFCDVWPCQNYGSCEKKDSGYGCVCPKFFTGPLCETFSCDPEVVCFGHGICNPYFNQSKPADLHSNSICLCENGYSGLDCKVDINECLLEGGNEACGMFHCLDKVGRHECDYCFQNKCKNGASCDPIDAKISTEVKCICTAAYSGTLCDIEQCVDPVVTCNNHGICKEDRDPSKPANESTNPLCTCHGYIGLHCETFVDLCTSDPPNGKAKCSLTNETCYARVNQFECGKPCESNPCMNGGACAVKANETGFDCHCPNGTTGARCETVLDIITPVHKESTTVSHHALGSVSTDMTWTSQSKVHFTSQSVLGSSSTTEIRICLPGKTCSGNGICNPESAHSSPGSQPLCICNAEYTGTNCAAKLVHHSSHGNRIAAGLAAGLSIALVVCTVLILLGIFIWRRRMRMRKSYMKIDRMSQELLDPNYFPAASNSDTNIRPTSSTSNGL